MGIFTMPSLGADMEAGKLIEWLVKPGDTVARGDVVAVVETQKGAIEIEIFEAGKVASLQADVGQTLPVGAPLAQILAAGEAEMSQPFPLPEQPPAAPPELPSAPPEPAPEPPGPEMPAPQPIELPDLPPSEIPLEVPPEATGVAASPAARARAASRGSGACSPVRLRPRWGNPAVRCRTTPDRCAGTIRQTAAAAQTRARHDGDAPRDRGGDGAVQTRDPALLPVAVVDLQPATDWLTAH